MAHSLKQVLARLERLEVLYKISNIVNTTLEPGEVLRLLLQEVVRITNATSGSIAMVDHRKGVLNIETAINIHPRLWKRLKLELGVGVTGHVAWTGKPLRVDNVDEDPYYVRLKSGIKSEMALPMTVNGRVIGVINVDSTRPAAFSEEDEELCIAVANESAQVIETARLHDTLKRQASELEALFTVGRTLIEAGPIEDILQGIVTEGLTLLDGKVCVVMEATGTGELQSWAVAGASRQWHETPPVKIANSLLGQVARNRSVLKIPDVRRHPRFRHPELAEQEGLSSVLAVPVVYQGAVLAVLALFTEEPRRFREPEVRLLQLLANQGAVAIESTRRMERLNRLEESLRVTERFSLLGTLAAEIAHEIRNPITIINLLMHSIEENATHTDQTREDLRIVTSKLERINQIVEQTLGIAKSTETNFKPAQINRLVDELVLFLNYKIQKARIEVVRKLDPRIPEVPMDAGQIQQVLLNMMLNAMQAMEEGGRLTVKTRLGRDRAIGPCVRCTISDTGAGITPEQRARLFDPFYTTREGGTGLGLFIANKLVRRHHGIIRVRSEPGSGSIFSFTLPLVQENTRS